MVERQRIVDKASVKQEAHTSVAFYWLDDLVLSVLKGLV